MRSRRREPPLRRPPDSLIQNNNQTPPLIHSLLFGGHRARAHVAPLLLLHGLHGLHGLEVCHDLEVPRAEHGGRRRDVEHGLLGGEELHRAYRVGRSQDRVGEHRTRHARPHRLDGGGGGGLGALHGQGTPLLYLHLGAHGGDEDVAGVREDSARRQLLGPLLGVDGPSGRVPSPPAAGCRSRALVRPPAPLRREAGEDVGVAGTASRAPVGGGGRVLGHGLGQHSSLAQGKR
mmetsp:Transcript_8465/g.29056  ORF Transcript_8465/g.29056 Transcript_8465/m.29056 type:complete len:233 (-) Transcript_8465:1157-1855(-)